MDLKLFIELVPQSSWYNNLRNKMSRMDWDKIQRTSYYADGYYVCRICGVSPPQLHCHEIWEYDDEQCIQTLKGFIALCPMCHHVKHIGLAGVLASKGELDFKSVVRHFMEVNNCSCKVFREHYTEAMEIYVQRSKHEWTVVLGEYENLVSR